MPMDCERGRTSERVTEEDWRVACWSAILRGRWSACAMDVRARSDSRGPVERSNLYMMCGICVA